MFNFIKVDFPDTTASPQYVYYANIYQNRYSHELAVIKFRDWGLEYDVVAPGTPVMLTISGRNSKRQMYGYVHHINPEKTPGKNFTEVVIIGASYRMRAPSQTIYRNTTADQVIKKIASKYNFVAYAVPHPRVYPQISQAGHTDWELMVRLARQCGYTLRAQNTELYFQPVLEDFTNFRASAPKFIMRSMSAPEGSTIYSFRPIIGESVDFDDVTKAAVAISGVDQFSKTPLSITKQKRNKKTRKKQQVEFFDSFDSAVVANDVETAGHEANAAEEHNAFPYRAVVEVLGDPDLRPDMPVFLEGIGQTYSGYWTILQTEQKIIEEERNRQRYTTILTVGVDSLGTANTWSDNKTIAAPDYAPKRTIVPNKKQTVVVPKTGLNMSAKALTPQSKGSFGSLNNRAKPVSNRSQETPKWKSQTASLNNIITEPKKTPIILDRILKRAGAR
jgi:phage protein D